MNGGKSMFTLLVFVYHFQWKTAITVVNGPLRTPMSNTLTSRVDTLTVRASDSSLALEYRALSLIRPRWSGVLCLLVNVFPGLRVRSLPNLLRMLPIQAMHGRRSVCLWWRYDA